MTEMESLTRKSLMHKILSVGCGMLLNIMCISCGNQEAYYRFHEIKDAEWDQNDMLVFDIDSVAFELNIPYSMSIEVTNNTNYPYRNIWFFVQTNFENDSVFAKQEMQYLLADKFGKWTGSGFGTLYQASFPFNNNIVFKEKRNYRVRIEHGMRDKQLEGIEKVGIRIAKKEQDLQI
ncbi:MAG: gliding motility lipoprotein GldH [Prevotella sp.]|jgi:gliding motility-associated lipoprotein GldH|nr:gliding motility lipoprotein GldH [Prevotella sp.]